MRIELIEVAAKGIEAGRRVVGKSWAVMMAVEKNDSTATNDRYENLLNPHLFGNLVSL